MLNEKNEYLWPYSSTLRAKTHRFTRTSRVLQRTVGHSRELNAISCQSPSVSIYNANSTKWKTEFSKWFLLEWKKKHSIQSSNLKLCKVTFDSKLFGIANEAVNPFGSGDCVPEWDSVIQKWKFEKNLGECDMDIANFIESDIE